MEEVDRLICIHRNTGDSHSLTVAWFTAEPYVTYLSRHTWSLYRYRVGTLIEPEDLVSIAKSLFLGRLLKKWNPEKGHFLRYALVTANVEFWKHLMGGYRRLAWQSPHDPQTVAFNAHPAGNDRNALEELRMDFEIALERLAERSPKFVKIVNSYLLNGNGSLRQIADAFGELRGFSKSSVHRALKSLRTWLEQVGRAEERTNVQT